MTGTGSRLDPASTWAVIPVRGLERAKSRLAGPLDAEERLDLVSRLLGRAIEAASSSPGKSQSTGLPCCSSVRVIAQTALASRSASDGEVR